MSPDSGEMRDLRYAHLRPVETAFRDAWKGLIDVWNGSVVRLLGAMQFVGRALQTVGAFTFLPCSLRESTIQEIHDSRLTGQKPLIYYS